MNLEELRKDLSLINDIDWEMTPEEAVTLYLEWGNNWTHGKKMVRSKRDTSYYFVINTWEHPPKIIFIRRNSDEARELLTLDIPEGLRESFLDEVGHNKGVYALTREVKDWLKGELGVAGDRRETTLFP